MTYIQTGIVPTNQAPFPFEPGKPIDAIPVNNKLFELMNANQNLQSQLTTLQTAQQTSNLGVSLMTSWGGGTTISAGPEYITIAPYEFTIVNMDVYVGTAGGNFEVAVYNNGSPIIGLDTIVSAQFPVNVVAISNNVINKGSLVSLQISNINGFPTNAYVCLNGTSNAIPEPLIGVGTAHAFGTAITLAIGTFSVGNQSFGFASGTSYVQAQAMAAFYAAGTAFGSSAGQALGAGILTNTRLGTATGTSTAQAFSQVANTYRMDVDPLDSRPLG